MATNDTAGPRVITLWALCPAGKVVLGGTARVEYDDSSLPGGVAVIPSPMSTDVFQFNFPDRWVFSATAEVISPFGVPGLGRLVVTAICADG